jgi:hypothetical protein
MRPGYSRTIEAVGNRIGTMPELAIYEVRVTGVKLSGLNPSIWPRPGVAAKGYFA